MKNNTNKVNYFSRTYLFLVILSTSALLTANTAAVKTIAVLGLSLPAGVIVFPISYIIGDALTEVYGFKKARLAIYLSFFANLFFSVTLAIAQKLPAASFWQQQEAFDSILGQSFRILLASFSGYLFGSLLNSLIMVKLKKVTKKKLLWLRTIASSILGEGVDSFLFVLVAFLGIMDRQALLAMILSQWLFKVSYEILITPLLYLAINKIQDIESQSVQKK
ncbi:MAG: queuosine precursor transporter [Candidatus Pacebacteria bacterium]|nr:queuosine precursor transporter [Candidatus Paceibacterota bacterium]